jgi:uncharacterized protein (DUF2461 family)
MNNKTFTGFAQEGLDFLQNVKKNNNKAWFEENKDVYQKHLLKPFQEGWLGDRPVIPLTRASVDKGR